MIRNLYPALTVAFLLATGPVAAQLAFEGKPYGDKAEKRGMPPATAIHLPVIDVEALLAEDAARAATGIKGRFRFGYTHAVQLDLENSGTWHAMPNGDRVWRLMLHCPEALAINLTFDRYVIAPGAKMYLYNQAGEVRGAFTAQSNPGHTAFGTAPLSGDRITVELVEPAGSNVASELSIDGVVHGYRDLLRKEGREFGASGDCNVNTICPEGDDWRNEIRSVAHIILGGGVCSGTLLNNCANGSIPYFLTANHCTSDLDNNAAWVFVFNWESPVCDPTENAPMDQSITGCDVLVESPATDVSFLRLSTTPPVEFNAYFSGWDKSGTTPLSVTGIHHPAGDIKKISGSDGPIIEGVMDGADCWNVVEWTYGTTEPGSSGSGLWNEEHHIVGQLFGGSAECGNSVNDFYGRFDLSYPLLAEWLGNCGDMLTGFDPNAIIPVPMDAAITSIFGFGLNQCNVDSIHPMVTVKNNGEGDLNTVDIVYSIDDVPAGLFPWSGIIHPLQTANIQLPWVTVPTGQHEFTARTADPNGDEDVDLTNDADSLEFLVSVPGEVVTLELHLDDYGTETTWYLATEDSLVLYEGGPYANEEGGYLVTVEFCLSHVCYVFTIEDAIGDGICCEYGNGFYQILDSADGVFVDGNGEFLDVQTNEFCVYGVGVSETAAGQGLLLMPNPSIGLVTLVLPYGSPSASIQVSDALGRAVWQQNAKTTDRVTMDLDHLATGTYLVTTDVDGMRYANRLVIQH